MVVGMVSIVELKECLWVIVSGVTISRVVMAIVVDNWVIGIVLPLELLIVSGITISELIGWLIDGVHEVHVFLIDWVVFKTEKRLRRWCLHDE